MHVDPRHHGNGIGEATAGREAYERSLGITFLDESEVEPGRAYDFRTRVIPSCVRFGIPPRLSGARVAVVGNGVVEGFGAEIDGHDEVIRISQMGRWRQSPGDDGVRITMWAGQLAFVAVDGTVDRTFGEVVARGTALWALSPFHITCDAFNFLRCRPVAPDLTILPSASFLRDSLGRHMGASEVDFLFEIVPPVQHVSGMIRHELLFTGTRLVLALELAGVRALSLYGFDLFTHSPRRPWIGHNPAVDLRVLTGVQRRFAETDREFSWRPAPPQLHAM